MSVERFLAAFEHLLESWAETKFAFERSVPLGDAWIHVIVGPLILLLAALVMRERIASWRPWLVVLLLISLNEFIDLVIGIWPRRAHRYGDSVSDFLLTMSIPTLLLIIARYTVSARGSIKAKEAPRRGAG